ncbi:MAG: TlpA family protein disulfide reductase [Chitinophagaceae bacterium]|nr:TlpA family protein disulfide reductase [Chitinophagaceae bacterium]
MNIASLISFLFVLFTMNGFAQSGDTIFDTIPGKYKPQFKEDLEKYSAYANPSMERLSKTGALLDAVERGYLKGLNKDSLLSAYELQKDTTYIKKIEFIRQLPDSYASLWVFNQWVLTSPRFSLDSLVNIFSFFNPELKETPLGKEVIASIKRKKILQLNNEMPLFTFKTEQDKYIDLASFRNKKYVLLCFWASWCGPCIRNIPLLKKIDSTYGKKELQTISISIDKNKKDWLSALKKYNMPWLQALDIRVNTEKGNIQTLYEIYYIPQYFLINKEGELIYQDFLDKDEEDHVKLLNLLTQTFQK